MERLARIGIMRFEELLERFEGGSLSHDEAAAALGISERTLRRWRQRYEEEGADGLVDRRIGRPSPKRAPEDELEGMRALYQQHYQGFTIKHFHEKLEKRQGLARADPSSLDATIKKIGDFVLVGSMVWSEETLGWVADWRLAAPGGAYRWQIRGVGFDEAFRNAMAGAAQVLSGHGQPG